MEHLAFDGAPLQDSSLGIVELVETRREQCLDRRRNGDLGRAVSVTALCEHREHLADEERVAAGRLEDAAAERPVDLRAGEEPLDQLFRLVRRERLEQDVRGVELSASPGGTAVKQLRSRHAEQQDRRIAAEIRDVLDKIEKYGLSPVEIVEDDDERPPGSGRFEQLAHGPGDLLGRARQRLPADNRVERPRSGGVEAQLRELLVRRRPEQLLHGRGHRPVADPLAVREAAAADHGRAVEAVEELRHQP